MRTGRRWAPRSLGRRLASAAAVAVLLGASAFALVTVLVVGAQLRTSLDDALRSRAEQVAQLAVSAPGVLATPGALEAPVSGRQIVVEVLDARGRILARSLALGARLLPAGAAAQAARVAGRAGFDDITLAGRPFRLFAAPIADAGGPAANGVVLVASDTSDITTTSSHLALLIGLIGAGIALLAAGVAAALARRGLRPLARLAAGAAEVERTADPSRRLPSESTSEELDALTGVLNRMLAALQRAQDGERRFLADASHELRTPVTTLLGNTEFALRHGADAELLRDLHVDASRLARLVDDLLVLERASTESEAGRAVQLDRLARELAAEDVLIEAPRPVWVVGEAEALRRMAVNLIQNARIHGPRGERIQIEVRRTGGEATLTVSDEGPGPDPAEIPRLFERFWRSGEAAGRPGSGLGLAIVAAVAERHGGRVSVAGSRFTVHLPALDPGPAPLMDSHSALTDT